MLHLLCGRLLRQQTAVAGLQQGVCAVLGQPSCSAAVSTAAASSSALDEPPASSSGGAVASSSYAPPPPRPWSSSSSSPAFPQPDVYKVDIVVKGFEPRFVREASTAIRDLLLVNFAPKGRSAVGQGPPPASMPHVNLELPFGEIKLKTLKTIYTVIRGPHVHKTSREQFAKITHRRRITHHTNNHSELQWFLDCLKLYEFHGVEIIVDVVTSSYMQPTTTADLDASQRPLLADHMQQFQQYFAPSPPATSSSSSSSSAAAASGYRADLQQLQAAVLEGLDELRYQLQGKQGYASWSWVQSSSSSVGTGDEAAPSAPPPSAAGAAAGVVEQLDQQLLSSTLAAGTSSSSGALQDAAAAAAQKVLQRLSPDKLTRPPSLAAAVLLQQAPPSDPEQLAQWLYALLQLDALQQQQQQQDLQQPDTAKRVAQAAAEYPQVVAALVYALLRAWHAQVVGPAASALRLPQSPEVVDKLLKDQKVTKPAKQAPRPGPSAS